MFLNHFKITYVADFNFKADRLIIIKLNNYMFDYMND